MPACQACISEMTQVTDSRASIQKRERSKSRRQKIRVDGKLIAFFSIAENELKPRLVTG
jgi:hypothetical protein